MSCDAFIFLYVGSLLLEAADTFTPCTSLSTSGSCVQSSGLVLLPVRGLPFDEFGRYATPDASRFYYGVAKYQ